MTTETLTTETLTLAQSEQNHAAALADCRRYADASARCISGLTERLADVEAVRTAAGAALADALLDGAEQKPDGKIAKALADALTGAERDREASRQLSAKWAKTAGNEAEHRRALIASKIQDALTRKQDATLKADTLRRKLAEIEQQLVELQAEAGDGGIIDKLEIEAEHADLAAARRVRLTLAWLDPETAEDQPFWPHLDALLADPAWPVDRAALADVLRGWRDGLRATDPEHKNQILFPLEIAILWDAATGSVVSVEILSVMMASGHLVRDTNLATVNPDHMENELASRIRTAEKRLGSDSNRDTIGDYVNSLLHPDHHVH